MQFKKGVQILDANQDSVGKLDRVVVDPRSGAVTHIVIGKGFFSADKVMQVDKIERTDDDHLWLNVTKDEIDDLPDFIETHYSEYAPDDPERAAAYQAAQPVFWYPSAVQGGVTFGGPAYWGAAMPHKIETTQNIPDGTIAIEEGAKVIANDGEEVGDVEKILTEDKANRITGLVITKGTFTKQRKIIPAEWIDAVKEDGVKLAVTSRFIEKLREYK